MEIFKHLFSNKLTLAIPLYQERLTLSIETTPSEHYKLMASMKAQNRNHKTINLGALEQQEDRTGMLVLGMESIQVKFLSLLVEHWMSKLLPSKML
jgi:hypothetical protein